MTTTRKVRRLVVLVLLALGSVAGASAQVTRGPYLQMGAPTGIVVRWRTATATDSRVRYGPAPGSLTQSADAAGAVTEHVVRLDGLNPGTKYFYSVGSTSGVLAGDDAAHFFFTAPTTGTRKPLRVWVLGDSGTANSNARAVRDAYETYNGGRYTDLWLMLGDNAYPDGTDAEYQAAVFDMYPRMLRESVLWPTLGNHDGHSATSSTQSGPYYDIFSLPAAGQSGGVASGTEAYYSFDFANIHFICLNSDDVDRSTSGAMLTWLRQDLANVTADWTIAFWHHPPYSKGSHDSDTESNLRQMRENALPILEEAGVDLVLSGHSHAYERSYLLDGHYGLSTTLTDAMKLDPGDGRESGTGAYAKPTLGPAAHEGAVYVVSGSSGSTGGGALNHPAMYLSLNVLGSVVLDVDGGRLDARFLDNAGAVRDSFTIVKGSATPTPPVADFAASPVNGRAPLAVSFTDRSTGSPTSWAWDFDNDGTTDSTERNPSHTYASAGTYTVRLTVSNAAGSDVETKVGYITATAVPAGLPVIPGAYGFGMGTPAGRGGTVYKVTTLAPSGAGSLRACVEASGPRVCVFEVSGTINLDAVLAARNPFLTIAGQTAPSPGITLRGYDLEIRTHDVLVQHVRVRVGDEHGGEPNGIKLQNAGSAPVYNVVVDHCSVSWAIDENLTVWGYTGERVHDVTLSNNIVSEALNNSTHSKGPHSKGLIIGDGDTRIAVLDNLFAHNADRNPELKGGATAIVANNIFYNWDPAQEATHIAWAELLPGEATLASVVGNVYKRGPDMPVSSAAYAVEVYSLAPPNSQLFMNDILCPSITPYKDEATFDPRVASPPIWIDGYTARPASEVEARVLARAGARPADRDSVDLRAVSDARNASGRIIDSQAQVGGWPTLAENVRPLTLPSDPSGDADGDGYTNLEEWLQAYAADVERTPPATPPANVTGVRRTDVR